MREMKKEGRARAFVLLIGWTSAGRMVVLEARQRTSEKEGVREMGGWEGEKIATAANSIGCANERSKRVPTR